MLDARRWRNQDDELWSSWDQDRVEGQVIEDHEDTNRRITLELTPDAFVKIEQLMAKVNLTSHARLFRDALQFYDWGVDEREAGRQVGSMDSQRRFYLLNDFNHPAPEDPS